MGKTSTPFKATVVLGEEIMDYLDSEVERTSLTRSVVVRQALASRRATQARVAEIEDEITAQEEGYY